MVVPLRLLGWGGGAEKVMQLAFAGYSMLEKARLNTEFTGVGAKAGPARFPEDELTLITGHH